MASPSDHAPSGERGPLDIRVARGAGVGSALPSGMLASTVVHAATIVGMYAGGLYWSTGEWRLIPPQPGDNRAASSGSNVLEVAAPIAEEAATAEAAAIAIERPVPEIAELLPARTIERSPIGDLPMVEAPPVDVEMPIADRQPQIVESTPVAKVSSESPLTRAEPTLALPRDKPAATVSTLTDARADVQITKSARSGVNSAGSSGAQSVPSPIYNPRPTYPPELLAKGIEGLVKLRVELNAAGQVKKADVSKSSGYDAFDRSALEIIYRWRFAAVGGNAPTRNEIIVPIRFGIVR